MKIIKIKYCKLCMGYFIECPDCGNNTCNGGSGEINGEPCTTCLKMYKIVDVIETNREVSDMIDEVLKS